MQNVKYESVYKSQMGEKIRPDKKEGRAILIIFEVGSPNEEEKVYILIIQ